MGHEKGKKFFSSYEGDQIDALLGAMAQANPLPSGTDWVAFIDDCREAQEAAEAAAASVEGAEETCAQSADSAADSANAAHEDADRAEEAAAHVDLPVKRGSGYNSLVVGDTENNEADIDYSAAFGAGTAAGGETFKGAFASGVSTYLWLSDYLPSINPRLYKLEQQTLAFEDDVLFYNGVYARVTDAHAGEYGDAIQVDRTLGNLDHARVFRTFAYGEAARASGLDASAVGEAAHAIGEGVVATGKAQLVFGAYNDPDPIPSDIGAQSEHLEIVGNGVTPSFRSNARTLDWQGNERLAGKLTLGKLPTGAMDAVPRCLVTNPNLLDNAYFVGGGSGYGVFPVNQRGITQYSAAGNIFDRWKLVSGTATLTAAGLVLNGTITQTISPAPDGDLTCSALTTAGLVTPTYSNGVVTLTGTGETFLAAKLERGSIQTLAHQESGAWVINSIPRYGEELRKCQLYYYVSSDDMATNNAKGANFGVAANASYIACGIRFPVTMAKAPVVNVVYCAAWDTATTNISSAIVPNDAVTKKGFAYINATNAFTAGKAYYIKYTASAEL